MKKIVLVTGGFDPLHSGHIAYFNAARELGDWLVVGVNSDAWLSRKKGRAFMPWKERAAIIEALKCVDQVIEFDDSNDSATETILKYKPIIVCEQQADTNYDAGAYLKSLGAKELTNVRKDYIFGW